MADFRAQSWDRICHWRTEKNSRVSHAYNTLLGGILKLVTIAHSKKPPSIFSQRIGYTIGELKQLHSSDEGMLELQRICIICAGIRVSQQELSFRAWRASLTQLGIEEEAESARTNSSGVPWQTRPLNALGTKEFQNENVQIEKESKRARARYQKMITKRTCVLQKRKC